MKRAKKLMAMLLALAMILSLGITALATEPTPVESYNAANTNNTKTGEASSEGAVPDDLVKITMPVVPTGGLNVYLDAHDLIKQSYAADGGRYEGATFNGNTRLYFKTDSENSTYTENSAIFSLVNKSSVPIAVQLDAGVKRATNKITFVDSLDKLDAAAKSALLYMAVQTVTSSEESDTPTVKATGVIAEEATGLPTLTATDDATNPILAASPAVPTFVWGTDEKVTEEVKAALNTALDNVEFTVTADYTAADTSVTPNTPATVKYTPALKTGSTIDTAKYVVTYNAATTTDADGAASIVIGAKKASGSGADFTIATITVPVKVAFADAEDVVATIKVAKFNPNGAATLKDKVANQEGAYTIKWTGTETNGHYEYANSDTYSDDAFEKLEFRLTGGINASTAWDVVEKEGGSGNDKNNIEISLKWTVERYDDPVDPTATATTKGTGKTGETVVISYNLGAGAPRATAIGDEIKLYDSTNKVVATLTKAATGTTVTTADTDFIKEEGVDKTQDGSKVEGTFTYVTATNSLKAAYGVVTFTLKHPDAKGSYTKEVKVEVK